jgi:hypothetical protein
VIAEYRWTPAYTNGQALLVNPVMYIHGLVVVPLPAVGAALAGDRRASAAAAARLRAAASAAALNDIEKVLTNGRLLVTRRRTSRTVAVTGSLSS